MTGTGKIHVYYGKGKREDHSGHVGQSPAGGRPRDLQVLVFQFLKDNSSGERRILEADPQHVPACRARDRVKFVKPDEPERSGQS